MTSRTGYAYYGTSPAPWNQDPYPIFQTNPYRYHGQYSPVSGFQHEPSWLASLPPYAATCEIPSPYHPGRHQRHRECFPTGKLFVNVVRARDIKGDECLHIGKADPCGVIKLGGKDFGDENVRRTKICKDEGSSPAWNEMFTFFIRKEDHEYNELTISLVNRNKFRHDNSLGQIRLSRSAHLMRYIGRTSHSAGSRYLGGKGWGYLTASMSFINNLGPYVSWFGNNVSAQWYPIIYKGVQRGEILLGFTFIPLSAVEMLSSVDIITVPASGSYGNSNALAKAKWSTSIQVGTGVLQVILAFASIMIPLL